MRRLCRRVAAIGIVAACVLGTVGCAPEPTPSPTPTAFANEAEAFAAAEATYRAYVDALNHVDLSDPETFEPVYAWTTGDANAAERKQLSEMHAAKWRVSGATQTVAFYADQYDDESAIVVSAVACSDVSTVKLTDSRNISVVRSDRPDIYALALDFVTSSESSTMFLISGSTAIQDDRCN